jgi:transcriptional regulator with XRE-family HTH domain
MDLASRLRAVRTSVVPPLSARELAGLAGVSPPVVSNLERVDADRPGEKVAARTVVALARVLGTSAEYLVDGEGDAPDPADVNAAVAKARAAKSNPDAAA